MTRTDSVAGDLLRYGVEQGGSHHGLGGYLNSDPTVDGQEVTEDEYQNAVDRAASLRLIETIRVNDALYPNALTAEGRHCVEAHGGNIQEYLQAQRTPGTTVYNYSTISMGDYGQASAFTRGGVTQSISQVSNDPERLRDVSAMAREVIPLLPETLHEEVRAAAGDVEVASTDPSNENRLRAAGARLAAALGPASGLFVIVRFIIDALSGGLGG